jgi:hypothetical protein
LNIHSFFTKEALTPQRRETNSRHQSDRKSLFDFIDLQKHKPYAKARYRTYCAKQKVTFRMSCKTQRRPYNAKADQRARQKPSAAKEINGVE